MSRSNPYSSSSGTSSRSSSSKTRTVKHFQTVESYVDYITPESKIFDATLNSREKNSRDNDFFGGSWTQALTAAKDGWTKGKEKLSEGFDFTPAGKNLSRIHDACGDLPDVGRFLAGSPLSMTRRVISDSKRRPIISILVKTVFTSGVNKDHAMNYGLAVCRAIDSLESAGYSVNISFLHGCSFSNKDESSCAIVSLKTSREFLDRERLIFWLACPMAFRRLGFSFIEHSGSINNIGYGYGVPPEISDFQHEIDPETIIFDTNSSGYSQCHSITAAIDFVKSQLPEILRESAAAAA